MLYLLTLILVSVTDLAVRFKLVKSPEVTLCD